jgi:hypothetical protein
MIYAPRGAGQSSAAFKLIRLPFIWAAHRLCVTAFEFHPSEIFPALLPKRDSCERALWYPSRGSSHMVMVRSAGSGGLWNEPALASADLFPDFGFARRLFDQRHGTGQP